MRRPSGFLAILIFSAALAPLGAQNIKLGLVNPESAEAPPGERVTLIASMLNEGSAVTGLLLDITAPDGWTLLTSPSSVDLAEGGSGILILPFSIPSGAAAGDYKVTCSLFSQSGFYRSSIDFPVQVSALPRLEITVLQAPGSAKAGSDYSISYAVANTGNLPLGVNASGKSSPDFPFALDPASASPLRLAPGEAAIIKAAISVPRNTRERLIHFFYLSLDAVGPGGETLKPLVKWTGTEIIPVVSAADADAIELPGSFGLETRGTSAYLEGISAAATLSLGGALDAERRHKIQLRAVKNLRLDDLLLIDPSDIFSASYKNPFLSVSAGDGSFSTTKLTDGIVQGFGASAHFDLPIDKMGTVGLGGYVKDNRRDPADPLAFAVHADYALPVFADHPNFQFSMRYAMAAELGGDFVFGMQQRLKPSKAVEAVLEVAASTPDGVAFSFDSKGAWSLWSYQAAFSIAEPSFAGPLANQWNLSLGGSCLLLDRALSISASYRQSDRNLGALAASGSDESSLDASLESSLWLFSRRTQISVGTGLRKRKDDFLPAAFDSLAGRLKLGLSQALADKIKLAIMGDAWLGRDSATGLDSLTQLYTLGLSAGPADGLSGTVSGTATFSSSLGSGGIPDTTSIAAAAEGSYAKGKLTAGLKLQAAWSFSGAALSFGKYGVTASAKAVLPWEHTLEACLTESCQQRMGDTGFVFDFKLAYKAPFNLRLGDRFRSARVNAYVYDDVTGLAVKGAVVRCGESAAITDSSGMVVFRLPVPGTHFIYVDPASLPAGYISRSKAPIELSLKDGKEARAEIVVTPAYSVKGNVRYFDFISLKASMEASPDQSPQEQADLYSERHDLAAQTVELRNGDDVRLAMTGADGQFSFQELYSGTWTLRLLPVKLPEFHFVVPPSMDIVLKDKPVETAELLVVPEIRVIQMTESWESMTVTVEDASPALNPEETPPPASEEAPAPVPEDATTIQE